jgi:hypothetical protein
MPFTDGRLKKSIVHPVLGQTEWRGSMDFQLGPGHLNFPGQREFRRYYFETFRGKDRKIMIYE